MQAYLSGRDGSRKLIHDATQSTWIFNPANAEVPPVRGYDVYLTIDSRLQAIVEEELKAGIEREKAAAGSFILMDCRTGDMLAMASYPTYDPNHFAEYPDAERANRRTNRAVESLYEPGSVVKPFLAAYVLETGLIRRDQLIHSLVVDPISWDGERPYAFFGRRPVRDVSSHEDLTLERAVIFSSNVCMGIIGYRVGEQRLRDMLDRFGLCRETGIDLPAEAAVPPQSPEDWKPLYTSVSVGFGYEMAVTPIQLCRALAAVVNGGYLLKPRIIDRIRRGSEEVEFPSRVVVGRPISEETSRQMREILHLVVEEGTARLLKIDGFPYGGKTGTADMGRSGYTKSDYLASFEAFAPYEDPQVVALCMIEKPRGDYFYGGRVAGPIVAGVLRRMFGVEQTTRLSRILAAQGQ
jgi:cell division protein FtsI/penicillin-binding protein 2